MFGRMGLQDLGGRVMLYAGCRMMVDAPTTLDSASTSMCVLLVPVPSTGHGNCRHTPEDSHFRQPYGRSRPLHRAHQRPRDL